MKHIGWFIVACTINASFRFIYYETRLITNSFFFFFIDYIIACKINNETQQMWEYELSFSGLVMSDCFPFQSLAPYLNWLHIHLLSLPLFLFHSPQSFLNDIQPLSTESLNARARHSPSIRSKHFFPPSSILVPSTLCTVSMYVNNY